MISIFIVRLQRMSDLQFDSKEVAIKIVAKESIASDNCFHGLILQLYESCNTDIL